MWRLVGGQPTCIEIKGYVRGPDERKPEQMLCTVSLEVFSLKLVYEDPTMFPVLLSASRTSKTRTPTDTGHKLQSKTTVPGNIRLLH